MKKLAIALFACLLVAAFTLPAAAIETQFGGYWRTRAWTAQNFTGEDDSERKDVSAVDTRTRLYFTNIFHENLKFVNKFEYNSYWGDGNGGDIGADGTGHIRVKNSYADFNLGPVNLKVGIQGAVLGRHFLFDDDFSGVNGQYKADNFAIGWGWIKAWEGGQGKDANDFDVDYYHLGASFTVADSVKIAPYFLYATSDDASGWTQVPLLSNTEELNLMYIGTDVDADFDNFSLWFTGIYQGGDMDLHTPTANNEDSLDFSAFLAAFGGNVGMNWGNIHGQVFYASGDDDENDGDIESFFVPRGQSYYWAEIMGLGKFGDTSFAQSSNNAPGDKIGNIMAGNIGVTVKPMDKLSVTLDVWYAALAEDVYFVKGIPVSKGTPGADSDDSLGIETDLTITYKLLDGLTLDIVGAYLVAGDATTLDAKEDANPYEVGTRLSLSF